MKTVSRLLIAGFATAFLMPQVLMGQEVSQDLDPASIKFDTIEHLESTASRTDPSKPGLETSTERVLSPSDQERTTRLSVTGNEPAATKPLPTVSAPASKVSTPATALLPLQDQTHNPKAMSPLQFAVKYPDSIVLNETASVRVQISNPGSVSVREARLILSLPKNVQFAGATPAPLSVTDKKIEFALQDLAPLGTSEVVIQVLPIDKHPISFETELQIVNREKVQIAVQQPILEIRPLGTSQLIMGNNATIDVEVTNVGDGPARNFRLAAAAAKGLVVQPHSEMSAGELKPGERRVFQISTAGILPGQTAMRLEAAATAAETRVAEMPFTVIKPELEIEVEGPKSAYIRHQGIYGIRIKNPSDAVIHDVRLELEIPAALKIQTVNREYTSDSNGSKIAWTIPQLAPGGSTDFRWISACNQVGAFEYVVTLSTRETQTKTIKIATVVDARPDLTMTIRNLTDPVAAGEATEYVIAVENHGNKAAHDVSIHVELPQTWVAISQGEQTFETPQRSVAFETKQIDPKAKQEFRFQAGSNRPGEYVVRAKLELQGSSLTLSAEDSALVYQSGTQKVSDKSGPAIR